MPSLRLEDEIDERLKRLAKMTGRTKTFYMKQAINAEITRLEQIYLPEALREMEKAGDLIGAEEVRKSLNLMAPGQTASSTPGAPLRTRINCE